MGERDKLVNEYKISEIEWSSGILLQIMVSMDDNALYISKPLKERILMLSLQRNDKYMRRGIG
jgi:hypothetical protein